MPKLDRRLSPTTMPVDTIACEEPVRRIRASTTVLEVIWDAVVNGEAIGKEAIATSIYHVKETLERDVAELSRVIWQNDEKEFLRRLKEREPADQKRQQEDAYEPPISSRARPQPRGPVAPG